MNAERSFGIEVEIADLGPNDRDIRGALDRLGWALVPDVSLRGDNPGEAVSPILQGEAGRQNLEQVCALLASHGARFNETCDTHIHFDASDFAWAHIRNLWALVSEIEKDIFATLPEHQQDLSRWHNSGRQLCSFPPWRILTVQDENELHDLWYDPSNCGMFGRLTDPKKFDLLFGREQQSNRYHPTRDHGLNLHSWFYRKTIEIRYLEGTADFARIWAWIETWLSILSGAQRRAGADGAAGQEVKGGGEPPCLPSTSTQAGTA